MAKKKKVAAVGKSAAPKRYDLERLPQAQAAWLVGLPASRLRDRANLAGRHADGTWHAAELVQGLLRDYEVASLSDHEVESVMKLIDDVDAEAAPALVDEVSRLAARTGPPGLAAIGELFLAALDAQKRWYTGDSKTEESIRQRMQEDLAELERRRRLQAGDSVAQCEYCKQYRIGRLWKGTRPPGPGAVYFVVCPECG